MHDICKEIMNTEEIIIYNIIEKLIVMLKFILKSLRCSKKEKLSEAVKSILFVSEVNVFNKRNLAAIMIVYIYRIRQK